MERSCRNRTGTRDSGNPGSGRTFFQTDRDTANNDLRAVGHLDRRFRYRWINDHRCELYRILGRGQNRQVDRWFAFRPCRSVTSLTIAPGRRLSETIWAFISSGQCRWTSRPDFLGMRTSNVLSMEKLPLLVHGKAITDQDGQSNVGTEHRLPLISRSMSNSASIRLTASSAIGEIGAARRGCRVWHSWRCRQHEELAPRVRPAERLHQRPRIAVYLEERIVAA